jgi:hypothetical protein
MFNTLGRFQGMNDEMGFIVLHSLAEYPLQQAEAAIVASGRQLISVGTGEGTNGWIPHTYGIIARYMPAQAKPMRAAHQQHWDLNFTAVNWLHIPVALASTLLVFCMFGLSIWRRQFDDFALLTATVSLALLGNAFVCGVLSGPHDRYGARLIWLATFAVLIAGLRHVASHHKAPAHLRRARKSSTPDL